MGVMPVLLPLLPWQAAHDAASVRMWALLLRLSVETKTSADMPLIGKPTEASMRLAKNQMLTFFMVFCIK
jgi:hypothetical protein